MKCVYSLPSGTMPATGPCFNNGGTYTGVSGASGSLTVGWNTSLGTNWSGGVGSGTLAGTYEISLYDVTKSSRRRHDAGDDSQRGLDVDAHALERRDVGRGERLQRRATSSRSTAPPIRR